MNRQPSFDAALASLSEKTGSGDPHQIMDGVWHRAGQLGEIAEMRRRAALFSGLFVVGLGAGFGASEVPRSLDPGTTIAVASFDSGERLSPAALLEGGR